MIICVCKGVSDKAIRRSVARGDVIALRDLTRETGLGTCCGKCVPAARDLLHSALTAATPALPVTMSVSAPAFEFPAGC